MAHDLDHDDAMVAVSGAVQTVNRLGGDAQSRRVAKSGVGHSHIVVNGLGQRDDVDASLVQTEGILLRTTSAEANDAIDSTLLEVVFDDAGHVLRAPSITMRCGLSRLVPRIVPPRVRMPERAERSRS